LDKIKSGLKELSVATDTEQIYSTFSQLEILPKSVLASRYHLLSGEMAIEEIEKTLIELNASLQSALKTLAGERRAELMTSLHDPNELPERRLYNLSTQTVDLLQEAKQLLEPRTVILADHFLG
jgi:hypothetical protein